jgi:DNA mismatch endonuclease, patch repair protein
MDKVSREQRSRNMSRVRQKNTQPELLLRSTLHRLGYRFRLSTPRLPGRPDIIFPGRKKVIFVHGCFWHGHTCRRGQVPSSNQDFWLPKLARNKARDAEAVNALQELGWSVKIVWECELRDLASLENELNSFLRTEPSEGLKVTV